VSIQICNLRQAHIKPLDTRYGSIPDACSFARRAHGVERICHGGGELDALGGLACGFVVARLEIRKTNVADCPLREESATGAWRSVPADYSVKQRHRN
jgi:hypothetical protein